MTLSYFIYILFHFISFMAWNLFFSSSLKFSHFVRNSLSSFDIYFKSLVYYNGVRGGPIFIIKCISSGCLNEEKNSDAVLQHIYAQNSHTRTHTHSGLCFSSSSSSSDFFFTSRFFFLPSTADFTLQRQKWQLHELRTQYQLRSDLFSFTHFDQIVALQQQQKGGKNHF